MKKYLTPSIEINKFDVEDIITASGDTYKNSAALEGTEAGELYTNAGTNGFTKDTANTIIEYAW